MILGLIDHDRGNMNAVTFEMLTLARRLANELDQPLEAVIVGVEGDGLSGQLPAYGVDRVHLIQHPLLEDYAPEAWAGSLVQLADSLSPEALLAPGSDRGNELMAHVAAMTDLPLAANCSEIRPGEIYEVTRVRWGGSLFEEARLGGSPKLMSVAPHTVPAEEASTAGELSRSIFTPTLDEKAFRVKITRREETTGDKISLGEARVVVGGGRGVGSEEGFAVLEELADLLGGAVGGSRVATNLGWRPHADQIGQTGTRIAPDIYIACGLSGAVQHMVGCKGSKNILAINTDPEAPIMANADYAVIGDLHEIIPALCEEIRKL